MPDAGSAGHARAFATLPPGTISPVMASVILADGAEWQRRLGELWTDGADEAARVAQQAAKTAQEAAASAALVAATEPSDPDAAAVARSAREKEREALRSARQAEDAAYQLEKLRRHSAVKWQQPPPSGARDRADPRPERPPSSPPKPDSNPA